MCRFCEQIAPICRWRPVRCLDDYFMGWGQDLIEIDERDDSNETEFCSICEDVGISYQAELPSPEADRQEPASRLVIVRTGMTTSNPQIPPRVAP